jgi:hypothetical protein
MFSPATQERSTLLLSAVVAIVILAAAVTAQPSRHSPVDRLANLESDLRFQLDLRWRADRSVYAERIAQLDRALAAWRESPRSEGDFRLLADWLRASIVSSLPGESGDLPAPPEFGAAPRVEIVAQARRAESPPAARPRASKAAAAASNASQHDPPRAPAPVASRRTDTAAAQNAAAPRLAASGRTPSSSPPAMAPPNSASPKAHAAPADAGRRPMRQPPRVDGPPTDTATPRSIVRKPAPAPESPPSRFASAVTADAPTAQPNSKSTPGASPPQVAVRVNVAELNARIRGYHDGVAEVEAAVIASRQKASVASVTMLVGKVEDLASQYQLVRLYYESLTDAERRRVSAPRPLGAVIELVEAQRRVVEATGSDFLGSFDDDEPASELAQRLQEAAEIAGAVEPTPPGG